MQSIKRFIQKTILIEIYKCLNNIGAAYLAKLFTLGKNNARSNSVDLFVPQVNQTTYGLHSLRYHGTQLWANLPQIAKQAEDLDSFKSALKDFNGIKCKCNMCKFYPEL